MNDHEWYERSHRNIKFYESFTIRLTKNKGADMSLEKIKQEAIDIKDDIVITEELCQATGRRYGFDSSLYTAHKDQLEELKSKQYLLARHI